MSQYTKRWRRAFQIVLNGAYGGYAIAGACDTAKRFRPGKMEDLSGNEDAGYDRKQGAKNARKPFHSVCPTIAYCWPELELAVGAAGAGCGVTFVSNIVCVG